MTGTREAAEMRAALLRLRRTTGLPVAFGGLLTDGRQQQLRIAELNGAATGALRGLAICAGNGLGGKSMALARPCAVTDYPAALHISHEYDAAVASEGLRSVVAVPVVVRRRVRGLLYGALRRPLVLGDRVLDAAVAAARDVEQALVVRDEMRQLLAMTGPPATGDAVGPRDGRPSARSTANPAPWRRASRIGPCARNSSPPAPGWPRARARRPRRPAGSR
ncbi:hypothetical protein RKD22_006124 [Streptomyces pristinaespiralis]